MDSSFLFLTDDLAIRDDVFNNPLKYRSDLIGINRVKNFVLKDAGFLRTDLQIETPSKLTMDVTAKGLSDSLLAAGFTISRDSSGPLGEIMDNGIPTMLISEKNCFLEFIEYAFEGKSLDIKCICKLNTPEAMKKAAKEKRFKCVNDYKICSSARNGRTQLHKIIRNILSQDIQRINRESIGKLPVFRMSQFLDYITWRSYMGVFIENRLIGKVQKHFETKFFDLLKKIRNKADLDIEIMGS